MKSEKLDQPETDTDIMDYDNRLSVQKATGRRYMPVYIASFLTAIWTGGVLYAAYYTGLLTGETLPPFTDLAIWIAGLTSPIVMFWLVTLVYQRTDPLLEHRLDVVRGLDKALAPIDAAEEQLQSLIQTIEQKVQAVEAAADSAKERISSLETQFQGQVDNLFTATADAEAKSVAIKDTLSRERNEQAELSKILAQRFESIEQRFENLGASIQQIAATLEQHADSAGETLAGHAKTARETADIASDTLTAISGTLTRQKEELAGSATESRDILEEAFENTLTRLQKMEQVIDGLEGRANSVAENLHKKASDFITLTEDAETRAGRVEEAVRSQAEGLKSAAKEAMESAGKAGASFTTQAGALEATAKDILAKTETLMQQSEEAIKARGDSILNITKAAMDNAFERINEASKTLENMSRELHERTKFASGETLDALEDLRRGVEKIADTIVITAKTERDDLDQITTTLTDQANMIHTAAREAAKGLREAGTVMDERAEGLGQRLSETRQHLEGVEGRLAEHREALIEATTRSAETLEESSRSLDNKTAHIESRVKELASDIKVQTEDMEGSVSGLEERVSEAINNLVAAADKVKGKNDSLESAISMSIDVLKTAAGTFETERDAFIAATDSAVQGLETGSSQLHERTEHMLETGRKAHADIKALSDTFQETASQITINATSATRAGEEAAERLSSRLSSAVELARLRIEETLGKLDTESVGGLQRLVNQFDASVSEVMSGLENAEMEAGQKTENAITSINQMAEQLITQTENFVKRASGIEAQLNKVSEDDFLKTSHLILDALQELSVDVERLLGSDISESDWKKYLKGDRGFFARRRVRMGSKDARQTINKRYESDEEFREAVDRFLKEFEGLMTRAMGKEKANALSVALISSDMGKLYVLLGQSIKKLK